MGGKIGNGDDIPGSKYPEQRSKSRGIKKPSVFEHKDKIKFANK